MKSRSWIEASVEPPDERERAITSVAVVGCGAMGTDIVQVIAHAGLFAKAIRARGGDERETLEQIDKALGRQVARGKLSAEERDRALAHLSVSAELEAVAEVDLIIESSMEELRHKRELLAQVEAYAKPSSILATNTSSLRLEALAADLRRTSQFLGLHFFKPVPAMALVEVGIGTGTAPAVVRAVRGFVQRIGKTAVEVSSEPGYIVNRLMLPYLLHAIESLESGLADADAIDAAMKLGAAHPMGPLALADFIGLDVVLAMSNTLHGELRDRRYRPPALLRRLVTSGAIGRKSDLGLYDYRGEVVTLNPTCRVHGE